MDYIVNIRRNGSIASLSHNIDEKCGMSIVVRDNASDQEVSTMVKAFFDLINSKSLRQGAIASSINALLTATGFTAISEAQITDLLRLKP
jgi:hypothetical protein